MLQRCKPPEADADGSKLMCRLPAVSLPVDLTEQLQQSQSGVIDNATCPGVAVYWASDRRARADVYIGLILDGFHDYQNISARRPEIKMQFAVMPSISCQSELVTFDPDHNDVISIQVWLINVSHWSLHGLYWVVTMIVHLLIRIIVL